MLYISLTLQYKVIHPRKTRADWRHILQWGNTSAVRIFKKHSPQNLIYSNLYRHLTPGKLLRSVTDHQTEAIFLISILNLGKYRSVLNTNPLGHHIYPCLPEAMSTFKTSLKCKVFNFCYSFLEIIFEKITPLVFTNLSLSFNWIHHLFILNVFRSHVL